MQLKNYNGGNMSFGKATRLEGIEKKILAIIKQKPYLTTNLVTGELVESGNKITWITVRNRLDELYDIKKVDKAVLGKKNEVVIWFPVKSN